MTHAASLPSVEDVAASRKRFGGSASGSSDRSNVPSTAEAMTNDKITGGVELFVLDESFSPQ